MKQLLLITLLALVSSCDLEPKDEDKNSEVRGLSEYLIGQTAEPTRALSAQEIRIGNLVCNAFVEMRRDIQPSYNASYKISEKNCQGVSTNPVVVPAKIYSDGEGMLIRQGNVHFRDVLSDKHSLLKEVCQNIDAQGSSIDTFNRAGNRKIKVHFKVISNKYFVQVFDFNKNVLTNIHTAHVATKDTANSNEGMVITRGLSKSCNNSRRVYSYTQELSL